MFLSAIFAFFSACTKEITYEEQLATDTEIIKNYIAEKKLTASSTPEGVYYVLENDGTGTAFPAPSSIVNAIYKGYFTSGSVFDQSEKAIEFPLSGVIKGWTIGMQKFKKGQKGKLLIPSGLAYGPSGVRGIPANAVLVFDIELTNFR